MVDVSVVIVCMNNLKNLYPCLDSIRKHTTVNIETLVVAYLFSPENLAKVKVDYPWVTFIESNEIRGFSENNNLALRQAKGKYCFVLNDDTEMKMDVVGELYRSFALCPTETAIISPKIIGSNGLVQFCGRPPINLKEYVLGSLSLWKESKDKRGYNNKAGIFLTYNITGAAFMIKTSVFEKLGFFDEYYFFCPEDIALSTLVNDEGYKCYVNSDVEIVHYEGNSGVGKVTKVKMATHPAGEMGALKFFSNKGKGLRPFLRCFAICCNFLRGIKYKVKSSMKFDSYDIISRANFNAAKALCMRKTPKEIFIRYFKKCKL